MCRLFVNYYYKWLACKEIDGGKRGVQREERRSTAALQIASSKSRQQLLEPAFRRRRPDPRAKPPIERKLDRPHWIAPCGTLRSEHSHPRKELREWKRGSEPDIPISWMNSRRVPGAAPRAVRPSRTLTSKEPDC